MRKGKEKLLAVGLVRRIRASLFIQRVSLTLMTRVLLFVLGFGISIITARYLGPAGRGIFAVTASITAMGVQFGNLGLHAANTYFIARDRSLLGKVIGNTIWVSLGGGAIIVLVALVAIYFHPAIAAGVPFHFVLIALLAIPFGLLALLGQNIVLGIQRIKVFNIFEFAQGVVNVLAIVVLLVLLKRGVFSLLALATVMAFLYSIVVIRYLWCIEKNRPGFDYSLLKKMARYGFKAYLAALFAFLVIRFDMLMVNFFLGSGDAGIYSIATGTADIIFMIPVSIGMILFPQVSSMRQGGWDYSRKVAWGTAGIMVAICIFAGLIARPFITFFYGHAFAGAAVAFQWLLPGILALSINTIFMNFLAARGMPVVVVISPFIALVTNILLNLYFIPHFGIKGAAMTSTIAYAMMLATSLIYLGANSNVRRE